MTKIIKIVNYWGGGAYGHLFAKSAKIKKNNKKISEKCFVKLSLKGPFVLEKIFSQSFSD